MRALFSAERWYRNSGCLGLSFDEIINEKGEHLPLSSYAGTNCSHCENKGEGRVLRC